MTLARQAAIKFTAEYDEFGRRMRVMIGDLDVTAAVGQGEISLQPFNNRLQLTIQFNGDAMEFL